ncbi:MAG TPA: hypothetical protein VK997_09985, partial [Deferrisomatales bacterium]|nr:hypothetical protein [Deferrisomatales bacterium]
LFPDLKVRYSTPLRECYAGSLALDADYIHWFFPKQRPRPRFNVNHKGDAFVIEGSGIPELRPDILRTLSEYGFSAAHTPQLRDGCLIALLHSELTSGRFRPARGNAMLVGDAGGLILPITYEGIGTAVYSGRLASAAILAAIAANRSAAALYLKELPPVIHTIDRLVKLEAEVSLSAERGPAALAEALSSAYQETAVVG